MGSRTAHKMPAHSIFAIYLLLTRSATLAAFTKLMRAWHTIIYIANCAPETWVRARVPPSPWWSWIKIGYFAVHAHNTHTPTPNFVWNSKVHQRDSRLLDCCFKSPAFPILPQNAVFLGENASQSAICFIYYVAALRHKCCDKNKQQQQGSRTDRVWLIYIQTSISRLITRLVPRKELLVHSLLGAAQSFKWARALSCF